MTRALPAARHDELEQLRGQLASLERTLGTLLRDDPAPTTEPAAASSRRPRKQAAATRPPPGAIRGSRTK